MSRTRAVGIDLGTTYSAVAWLPDTGRSTMIPGREDIAVGVSTVLFEDEEIVVGKEARKARVLKINRYAECDGRLSVQVKVGGGDRVAQQEITRDNTMSREQLDAWRKRIAGE